MIFSTKAQEYIAKGWAILPLKPNAKIPQDETSTYKHATTDPVKISFWSRKWPNSNIAIQPKLSGLIVLDIDVKSGGLDSLAELEKTHGPITTRSATTGTSGRHFYFKYNGNNISNKIGVRPGVDIIYDKNHVVAPPSIHPNGNPYKWDNELQDLEPAPNWLIELAKNEREPVKTSNPNSSLSLIKGYRGRLSAETLDFITYPAEPGTWNTRLFKAAKDYQEQGYTQDEFELALENVAPNGLDNVDKATIRSAFKSAARYAPRPNNTVKEIILNSDLIKSVADPSVQVFVSKESGKAYSNLSPELINHVLNKKERADYLQSSKIWAEFVYEPHLLGPLHLDEATGLYKYNTYLPPTWLNDSFYNGTPASKINELPELYKKFFKHLTDNHTPSFEYLLDWIATSIKGRNWTLLTAIGDEGIGKGTLGQILQLIHGDSNYAKVRDTVFKKEFNGALKNKTLVHVDEIDLKTKEAIDRMKDVVNETIEIEEKGVDSHMVRNHASFYLNSNTMDAIKIGPGDRRYSIIELTNQKLTQTEKLNISELTKLENIEQLGRYLLNHEVKSNMMIPFRSSQRYEDVKEAGLAEWESWVIETWAPMNKGQTMTLADFQQRIQTGLSLKFAPGRIKLTELSKKYSHIIKLYKQGSTRMIEVI